MKELFVEARLAEIMIQSGPQNADNSSTYSVLGEGRWACECECDGTSGPSAAAISACAPGAPVRDDAAHSCSSSAHRPAVGRCGSSAQ